MPSYDYIAFKPGEKDPVRGRIDADTERDARSKLRSRGETPTSIKEIRVGTTGLSRFFPSISGNFQKELLIFTTQLSSLIRSGITLTDALRLLADQSTNREFSNMIKLVYQSVVEKGNTFASSLKEFPKCFPHLYVAMVHAGESTGTLPDVLTRLASYAKKKEMIESKVKSALTYPIIMLIAGILIVVFLLSYLVPKITPILKRRGDALPTATEWLLWISDMVQSYWWVLAVVSLTLVMLFKWAVSTPKGKYFVDKLYLSLPIFGDLNKKAAVSRFCVTLSSLLKSGVKIENALKIVEEVVGNAVVAETVRNISERIKEGESISAPLEANNVFPKVVTYMISIGEKAGSEELQEMLDNIAESYDVEIEQSAERMTAMLNPILLVFLAGMVVFILMAILLPIMNLSNIK